MCHVRYIFQMIISCLHNILYSYKISDRVRKNINYAQTDIFPPTKYLIQYCIYVRFNGNTKIELNQQQKINYILMISKPNPENQISTHQAANSQGDMNYTPSKYSKVFNIYSRTQIKTILPFIASISRTCSYSSLFPICKVLKAISKIFMLNEIEIIFLSYIIRETNWDIRDRIIYQNADNVQDIIYYSIDNLDYKRIILYLMVTAFTIKFYLNQNTLDILEEAIKKCPNFKQIFQSWNKKHSNIITKVNPRTLNVVYKKLYSSVKTDKPDFNMIVDAIIQISPAYNPERQKQTHQHKKKTNQKKQIQFTIKKQQVTNIKIQGGKSIFIPPASLFTSSGLFNMRGSHQPQPTSDNYQNNQGFSGMNFFTRKSDRQSYIGIMKSSVLGGIDQGVSLDQDVDCGELLIGLQDGQSQQNIIFEQRGMNNSGVGFQLLSHTNQNQAQQTPYYTSVINLTRRSSIPRDTLGTSQIFISANNSMTNIQVNPDNNNNDNNNMNRSRVQASFVNLQPVNKQV